MTGTLIGVDAALAVTVLMLIQLIVVVRTVAIQRSRRYGRLRPAAETAVAEFLAGGADLPAYRRKAERAALLDAAVEALADLQGRERVRLVGMLGRLGFADEAAVRLRSSRRAVRQRAAETLAAIATPEAIPVLSQGLGDRDDIVQTTCARVLAEVGGPEVTGVVLATVERTIAHRPGAAAAVVLAIGANHPTALGALLGPGTPPRSRAIAITVAGQLRLSEHAPALIACLADRDDLAARAAQGLGRIGEVAAVPELTRLSLAAGRSLAARVAAVKALGAIGDPAAVTVVRQHLMAPDWQLAASAAGALARLGEPGLAVLRDSAASHLPQVAGLADAALER